MKKLDREVTYKGKLTDAEFDTLNKHITDCVDSFKTVKKSATVLKSFRTEFGAKDWLKTQAKLGTLPEGAIIVKSFDDYDMPVSYMPPAPVHVIQESMAPVAEVVSVKDSDEMFKAMFQKDLIEVCNGMISVSSKFYELLNQFACKVISDGMLMKSVTGENEVLTKLFFDYSDIQKAAMTPVAEDATGDESRAKAPGGEPAKLAPTEEDASHTKENNSAIAEDGTGDTSRPGTETTADKAPKLAVSQEDADNKTGTIAAVSDAEAKMYFKSFDQGRQWLKAHPEFHISATTLDEKRERGNKYGYVASIKAKINVGNRKK